MEERKEGVKKGTEEKGKKKVSMTGISILHENTWRQRGRANREHQEPLQIEWFGKKTQKTILSRDLNDRKSATGKSKGESNLIKILLYPNVSQGTAGGDREGSNAISNQNAPFCK